MRCIHRPAALALVFLFAACLVGCPPLRVEIDAEGVDGFATESRLILEQPIYDDSATERTFIAANVPDLCPAYQAAAERLTEIADEYEMDPEGTTDDPPFCEMMNGVLDDLAEWVDMAYFDGATYLTGGYYDPSEGWPSTPVEGTFPLDGQETAVFSARLLVFETDRESFLASIDCSTDGFATNYLETARQELWLVDGEATLTGDGDAWTLAIPEAGLEEWDDDAQEGTDVGTMELPEASFETCEVPYTWLPIQPY